MDTQTYDFQGGEIVRFLNYDAPTVEGSEPILEKDDRLVVRSVNDDGGLVCIPVDDADKPITGKMGDTVFPEEIEILAEAETVTEPAKTSAKAKKTTAKKSTVPSKKAATKPAKKAAKKTKTKKTAAKPKAEAKPEAPAVTIKHDVDVLALIKEHGALQAAKNLVESAGATYFTLGGVLHEILDKGLHEDSGYTGKEGFEEYIESNLGIHYRKAMDCIKIYTTFRHPSVLRKLTSKRLATMGWSKAKELARVEADMLAKDFDELYEKATTGTRDALVDHIKSKYQVAQRDAGKVKVTTFKFKLSGDNAENAEKALKAAQETLEEGDDVNSAFDKICTEWLATIDGVAVPQVPFDDVDSLIAYAEDKFDATLTEIDSE